MVLLVFLSRLYTKGQELECDGGVHGCCVNTECNEQPYCQTKTYQATLSVQKDKQIKYIFYKNTLERMYQQKLKLILQYLHRFKSMG